jgi:CheY-like chemotaxis protein
MARVPSFAQTEPAFRPLATAARRLAVTGRSCARCGSLEIRPSNRRNALDILLACVLLAPYRCRVCRQRFYRLWRPSLQRSPAPPMAPLLFMPARGRGSALGATEPRRIQPEARQPQRTPPQLIPSAVRPEPSPPPAPAIPVPSAPGPILILEDDLSIRKLLRRLLERRGHSIVEIEHADQLPGELLDRNVALLIVDVSTVDDGVQAVVKLARALPGLKILAISAEPLPNNEMPARLLALPKPFPLDSFVDGVDRLVPRPGPPDTTL